MSDADCTPGREPLSVAPSLVHFNCGQTARWIKMPLGREVDFVPGHIVLDGDPAPPPPKGHAPNFWLMSIVALGRPSQLLLSTCF